jgi:Zn-dependent M28 family amino/carboxypeptidase
MTKLLGIGMAFVGPGRNDDARGVAGVVGDIGKLRAR